MRTLLLLLRLRLIIRINVRVLRIRHDCRINDRVLCRLNDRVLHHRPTCRISFHMLRLNFTSPSFCLVVAILRLLRRIIPLEAWRLRIPSLCMPRKLLQPQIQEAILLPLHFSVVTVVLRLSGLRRRHRSLFEKKLLEDAGVASLVQICQTRRTGR